MKNDVVMYEKVYQIMKNKIECGLLPGGTRLPSRANLCKEFNTSEKTVRRVIRMLAEDGLVEAEQRKRPVVASDAAARYQNAQLAIQKADATAAADILKSGILLCYPVVGRGMSLCTGSEWDIPEAIIENMDPEHPTEFWRLSNRLWRFFISRNGNELILRAVDSLGFSELDPLPGSLETRTRFHKALRKLTETLKSGGRPESVHFEDLHVLYDFLEENKGKTVLKTLPDSPMAVGTKGLEYQLRRTQERYSSLYLDLLSLIAGGRYKPGDRLPSHEELQKIYGVSIDTTMKAVQILQEWGVVTAVRGRGIFVSMDLAGLKKIQIDPRLIASHVRRFLDSLELLSLTVEGVAAHAAEHAAREEAGSLYEDINVLWNGPYLYQQSPIVVLDFLVEHIRYEALETIYEMLRKDYHIGKSIPKLVNRAKTEGSCRIYHQSMEAASLLMEGDSKGFAKKTAEMFQITRKMVMEECKRLGYWEAAMAVYDGAALWR